MVIGSLVAEFRCGFCYFGFSSLPAVPELQSLFGVNLESETILGCAFTLYGSFEYHSTWSKSTRSL
jgi:hypothetical protein